MLFWGNEVLTEIGGVLEFYGKENAVRRQWEREEKEEKKENLEGKQRWRLSVSSPSFII